MSGHILSTLPAIAKKRQDTSKNSEILPKKTEKSASSPQKYGATLLLLLLYILDAAREGEGGSVYFFKSERFIFLPP